MMKLFQNKKQKVVWVIIAIALFLSINNLNIYDPLSGFLSFIAWVIVICLIGLIVSSVLQDKR